MRRGTSLPGHGRQARAGKGGLTDSPVTLHLPSPQGFRRSLQQLPDTSGAEALAGAGMSGAVWWSEAAAAVVGSGLYDEPEWFDRPDGSGLAPPCSLGPGYGSSESNISLDGVADAGGLVIISGGGIGIAGGLASGPGGSPDPQRTRAAIEHLSQKILKTTEQIKVEQAVRDENVAEYLKLANNADRQQVGRIKNVFEKKNQKSAAAIAQLQRKLEGYRRRLRDVELNGAGPGGAGLGGAGLGGRPAKGVLGGVTQGLRGVSTSVRAGISGFSEGVVDSVRGGLSGLSQVTHSAAGAVVSKPREFATLIRSKFGSADNLNALEEGGGGADDSAVSGDAHHSSPRLFGSDDEDSSSSTSDSGGGGEQHVGSRGTRQPPSRGTVVVRWGRRLGAVGRDVGGGRRRRWSGGAAAAGSAGLEAILEELREIRDAQCRLEEALGELKSQRQHDYALINQALHEEHFKFERLEEQLNDLTELHQNEMMNLRQELVSMEEKVAYQAYERARDTQEVLESCQTRVSKLELQHQQQQVVQLEGLESADARALLGKLINVLLAVVAVVLVCVSAATSCLAPLLRTRGGVLSTLMALAAAALTCRHWDAIASIVDGMHGQGHPAQS
uniref:LOW QUALITY PROTEIN: transmembrane and coiled-coil domains protein 2-like n=1 Tax=Petromyzon marinus TaxID=7757 RepID=A0AAJ7TZW3_PETMA|nr:LOW QUALITY PROTEIN: transmembrane and coiled-coil domains protein 2-like [Petromyzon marinus]